MFTTLFLICFVFVSSYFPSLINATTEEKIEFGYNGYNGPQNWHLLKNSDIICKNGKNQSPINIMPEELKKFAKPPCPTFNDAHYVESHNTGNTVELSSTDMSNTTIKIKGKLYELQQFHFHTPSEHRINGKYHDVEQHLVFKSVDGKERTSVVSVFYDISLKNSTFMDPIIQNIPVNVDEKKKVEKIELSNLLCDINYITKAYTYSGSLTTPPCTEGVTWYVNTKPLNIGMNQLVHLRHALGFNSRFTQQRFNYPKKKCTTH